MLEEKKPETRVANNAKGEPLITLDKEAETAIGLQTAKVEEAKYAPVLEGLARAVDPGPMVQLWADLQTAEITAAGSSNELARLEILAKQNNASTRSLQAAISAAMRDKASLEVARFRLASWAPELTNRAELENLFHSLATNGQLVLEVCLSPAEGAKLGVRPASITFKPPGSETILTARVLSKAAATDPELRGPCWLFHTDPPNPPVAAGEVFPAQMPLARPPESGLRFPASSIVRWNGADFIFVREKDEQYRRVRVNLRETPSADELIGTAKDVSAGDWVVTVGAEELLGEEQKSGTTPD